jgi:chromosome partitioning protein
MGFPDPAEIGPSPREALESSVRTIAIINQKGGCGKTTSAINLAGVFSKSGLRTLLVDLDPQSHCAAGLAIPEQRIDVQIGDAMQARDDQSIDWTRLLWRVSRNFDLAPSTVRLAGLESARGGLAAEADGHKRLLSVLSRVGDQYDVCLIDCPPSIGLLTYNALVAASEVLIPVETAFFSLQGAGKQVNTIKALAKKLGVAPEYRLLATMHNEQSPLARDLLEELNRRFEAKVIPVVVRFDPSLREAVSFGQAVVDYAPHSSGAEDYLALGRWLIEHADPSQPLKPVKTGGDSSPVTVIPGVVETVLSRSTTDAIAAASPAPKVADPSAAALSRAQDLANRAQRLLSRLDGAPTTREPALPTMDQVLRARAAAKQAAAAGQSLAGVRVTNQGVLFIQPVSVGQVVAIAGAFNGWSPAAHVMRRNDELGVYEICIPLPPGKHPYRLVVDGRWITDPSNPQLEPNPFGDANSVVEVVPAGVPALSTT